MFVTFRSDFVVRWRLADAGYWNLEGADVMRGKPQEGDAKFSVQSSRVAGGIMLVLRGELDLRTASLPRRHWRTPSDLTNSSRLTFGICRLWIRLVYD